MIKVTNTVLDAAWIKAIIPKVCLEASLRGPIGGLAASSFDVMVKNGRRHRARAYPKGSGYHATARPFIVVVVARSVTYPHTFEQVVGKGYLKHTVYSAEEAYIHLLAHEIRHLWQAKYPGCARVYGSRGKFSERDADAYGIRCVRRYRQGLL